MEDIVILKKLDFLSGLSTLELTKINAITHRAAFKPGDTIVREGTVGDSMYLIKKGSATVARGGKTLAKLGPGDPIGEIAFIDKGPRSASVEADEDSVLIEIPGEDFERLLEQYKDIAIKVYRAITMTLCRRLRNTNEGLPPGG